MKRWGWERLAALAGIVAVVLWIVGLLVMESTDSPDDSAEALRWYQEDSDTILASGFIFQLGALFFLVFLAALRHRLWFAEGRMAFLSSLAFAGGVAAAIFLLALPGGDMTGALSEDDLGAEAAQALNNLDVLFFLGAELSAAALVAAVGLLTAWPPKATTPPTAPPPTEPTSPVLPRWFGWISLLLALWLLIPPIGWAGLLVGLPLWVLVTSVMLFLLKPPWPGPPPLSHSFIRTE